MNDERRRHRLYRTRNTDYFLRDRECVGVRDRATGCWLRHHVALRMVAAELPDALEQPPEHGLRLNFVGACDDLVTSPLESIERPALHTVVYYVSHARSGVIDLAAA